MLFESLLGEPVEGERGDGAFEMRGGDTPGAEGATPASEVISFDPDQAFIAHTSFMHCVWNSARARRVGTHHCIERRGWTPARRRIFCTDLQWRKVTNGRRPVSHWRTALSGGYDEVWQEGRLL